MNFTQTWLNTVRTTLMTGEEARPRGMLTKEVLQRTTIVDMRHPVLLAASRGLSYRFMAAEAYWILSGDDRVDGIAPYNGKIADFSDDGVRFFGAYGPKIRAQLDYVVEALVKDPFTRQAVMTIWRENPQPSKDIPCTVAVSFTLRSHRLTTHVFMRSSDIWLGLPYDVFNFSMLGHLVCAKLNERTADLAPTKPGFLYLTAANSHLYQRNWDEAQICLDANGHGDVINFEQPTPDLMYESEDKLMAFLKSLRETKAGDVLRWWEQAS